MPILRRVAAALASGTVLAVLAISPAHAVAPGYVALGDSYSSGTGTRSYLADGSSCQRSIYAYPSLIASSKGLALNFRACSGATTTDVSNLQLGFLNSATAYVTITVGGNDAGFASVLTECAKPAWASNCNGAIDRAQSIITSQLPGRLTGLFAAIRSNAPNARVVVAGYPRIFNRVDCNAFTWFSPAEEDRLNSTADLLDATLTRAAGNARFSFTSPVSAFLQHAVCDNPEWLNGLSYPTSESYHPNRIGHASGYAPLIAPALTGSPLALTAATMRDAKFSAARLAVQQRRYAALDRMITPKEFKVPDLASPQIKQAAARAGVDLRSRASIDRMDKKYAALQARTHR